MWSVRGHICWAIKPVWKPLNRRQKYLQKNTNKSDEAGSSLVLHWLRHELHLICLSMCDIYVIKIRILLLLLYWSVLCVSLSPYSVAPFVWFSRMSFFTCVFYWSNDKIVPRLPNTHLSPSPPHSLFPLSWQCDNTQNTILSFVSYKEERNCSHFTRRIDCLYGAKLSGGGSCVLWFCCVVYEWPW